MRFFFGWRELWMGTSPEKRQQVEATLNEHGIAFRIKQRSTHRPFPNRAEGMMIGPARSGRPPHFIYHIFVQKQNLAAAEFLLRQAERERERTAGF